MDVVKTVSPSTLSGRWHIVVVFPEGIVAISTKTDAAVAAGVQI
jgi:hypothetical protein